MLTEVLTISQILRNMKLHSCVQKSTTPYVNEFRLASRLNFGVNSITVFFHSTVMVDAADSVIYIFLPRKLMQDIPPNLQLITKPCNNQRKDLATKLYFI